MLQSLIGSKPTTKKHGIQNKVLITGSEGFIGSHLMKAFPDAVGYDLVNGDDILDTRRLVDIVQEYRPNVIIHLAAVSGVEYGPQECSMTNIVGTNNVIGAAIESNVKKIIFASSAAVYPDFDDSFDEKYICIPKTAYGISKRAAEMYLQLASIWIDNIIILRLFNVYGPRSRSVINKFIQAGHSKRSATIYGSGKQSRDFIYIDDVVEVFKQFVEKNFENGVYNVATGESTSILSLTKIMTEKFLSFAFRFDDPRLETETSKANISKIKSVLKWKPKVSLLEGIDKTIQYHKENYVYRRDTQPS